MAGPADYARHVMSGQPAAGDHAVMPLIDVYATAGTFASKHDLAQQLAAAVMRWEQVPPIAP